MKPFIYIITLLLTLPLVSYRDKDLEGEKYLNFITAIENSSTFNYFTVIKVKDLNTGLTKEICTKGNFVSGALHIELKADYDYKGERKVLNFAKGKSNRYFEFRNKAALDNISFYDYDPNQLSKIQREYNFDKIVAIIKQNKKFALTLSDPNMKLFAHVLFNKGYMTGENDSFGGTLEYIDRKKDKE